MKVLVPLFFCLLFCILSFDEQTVATLTTPRSVFVLVLLFWVRCEVFMRLRVDAMCHAVETMCHSVKADKMTKEAHGLGGTVVSLSDHHALLCEIRNLSQTMVNLSDQRVLLHEIRSDVRKSARCSRDVLDRMDCSSSPGSLSSCDRALLQRVETARKQFRRSGTSESCISVPGTLLDQNGELR
jgi:hypothetical protein